MLGLLEPALAYLGDTSGLSRTSAVDGSILSGLEPALVVVLAAILLGEIVTRPAILAVVLALGGLAVLAGAGRSHSASIGDLYVAGGISARVSTRSWRNASTTAQTHCRSPHGNSRRHRYCRCRS